MILFISHLLLFLPASICNAVAQDEPVKIVCRINGESFTPYHGYHNGLLTLDDTITFELAGRRNSRYQIDTIMLWLNLAESVPFSKDANIGATGSVHRGTEVFENVLIKILPSEISKTPRVTIQMRNFVALKFEDLRTLLTDDEFNDLIFGNRPDLESKLLKTDKIRFQLAKIYVYPEQGKRKVLQANAEFKFVVK